MGAFSFWHILVVLVLVLLLFGRGKISGLMGDFAQGIKSFKRGMADDTATKTEEPAKTIDAKVESTANARKETAQG